MPEEKCKTRTVLFVDNPALQSGSDRYVRIEVLVGPVLKSWKHSLYSFEWLRPDGTIKSAEELTENEQNKRRAVEKKLAAMQPVDMPVLGIGVMDNIEIGIGRAEFLTLAAHGITRMPVHIPASTESDFKPFRADIQSGS